MVNRKQKGSVFERDVVAVFRQGGFAQADRRLAGQLDDRGDIQGVPSLTIECKNHRDQAEAMRLAVDEMVTARIVNGHRFGVGVVKRRLKPAEQAYAVMPLADFVTLWRMLTTGDSTADRTELEGQLTIDDV